MTESSTVIQPSHYNLGSIETIDYLRDNLTPELYEGFCIGNVIKYISRYKSKGGVEDLKKAQVYLDWAIKELEERPLD